MLLVIIQVALAALILGFLYIRIIRREVPKPIGTWQALVPVLFGVVSTLVSTLLTVAISIGLGLLGARVDEIGNPVVQSAVKALVGAGLTEEIIKFEDRYSKLIYIYTLLHPKGYQRRSLNKPGQFFPELASLYRAIFMADPERMIAAAEKDFNHMMSMAVAFVRKAIDKMIGCEDLTIGNPRQYYGRTVIPAVYNGLKVIIDSQLPNLK